MSLQIDSHFDSGAITVVDASNAAHVRLRLRDDNAGAFRQWFHFRLSGVRGQSLGLYFENAGASSYPEGWCDYQVCASYDREHWFRLPDTRYQDGVMSVHFEALHDVLWLAYFEPYGEERHQACIAAAQLHPQVRLQQIGRSVQGRAIDLLQIGTAGKPKLWLVARQHPGETMAEWFAEGFIEALLGGDAWAQGLRAAAEFYVVPNINPDGAFLGNLRSNAVGTNLNREWVAPSAEKSPEVLCVRTAMQAWGVDLFLDIHGDETLPYVFVDGSQMVPGYGEANIQAQERLLAAFAAAAPEFQSTYGYADDRFKDELLTLASKWVAHHFRCVSLTLEMPFKDTANLPQPGLGWSRARSKTLARAMLQALQVHLAALPG